MPPKHSPKPREPNSVLFAFRILLEHQTTIRQQIDRLTEVPSPSSWWRQGTGTINLGGFTTVALLLHCINS